MLGADYPDELTKEGASELIDRHKDRAKEERAREKKSRRKPTKAEQKAQGCLFLLALAGIGWIYSQCSH